MNQPDLFPVGFSIAPGKRAFNPRPCPENHKRVMLSCGKKECKFCKAWDLPLVDVPSKYGGPIQKLVDSNALYQAKLSTACPQHGASWIKTNILEGTVSEACPCDPRCTGARGWKCECMCGGANHGSDYL